MYKSIDCAFAKVRENFDIYRPSKSGSCPLPLAIRTLIKSEVTCNDGGAINTGLDATVLSLDECETHCKEELLCVWFQYKPDNGKCGGRKEGCEATAVASSGWNSYRPAGYGYPECNLETTSIPKNEFCN